MTNNQTTNNLENNNKKSTIEIPNTEAFHKSISFIGLVQQIFGVLAMIGAVILIISNLITLFSSAFIIGLLGLIVGVLEAYIGYLLFASGSQFKAAALTTNGDTLANALLILAKYWKFVVFMAVASILLVLVIFVFTASAAAIYY